MVLPTGISRRHLTFAITTLGLLWVWVSLDRPTSFSPPRIWNVYKDHDPKLVSPSQDMFDFPPLDSWVVRDVCESTQWNSSLIFTCDNNHGGVGHVRNSILNCVRYAISAGASLVMPMIALREDEDSNMIEHDDGHPKTRRHGPGRKGIEYMFDKAHFKHSLRKSCPELHLIDDLEQSSGGRRHALLPEMLESNHPASGLEHPELWRSKFYTWIESTIPDTPTTDPIIIDLEQSFLSYPTASDGSRFASSFGQILKLRPDVRRLATQVLKQMDSWYDLRLDLSLPILANSFLGAHLSTEDPSLEVHGLLGKRHADEVTFSHYPAQASAYLSTARALGIGIMYIASGNRSAVHQMSRQGATLDVEVTHKEALLRDGDLEELERLRWDQRALVDFLVVGKGQEFVGVGHSSFSWNVVLRRHEYVRGRGVLEGVQPDGVWGDGVSGLFGVRRGYVESSGCMWP